MFCFFCGAEIPENTEPATLVRYYVCDECKKEMDKGIVVVAIDSKPSFKGQEPICEYVHDENGEQKEKIYPTGEWAVFSEQTIRTLFGEDTEKVSRILIQKSAWVSPEVFDEIKQVYKDLRVKHTDSDTDTDEDSDESKESNDSKGMASNLYDDYDPENDPNMEDDGK